MIHDTGSEFQAINVFVHLAAGHDAEEWAKKWADGSLIGVNDPSPYGYARAGDMGCKVIFAKGGKEGPVGKYFRLGLRYLLGFDYIHARNNRQAIYAADVIWTHTESQFLAVALLFLLDRRPDRPKLLGQAVWLIDKWPKLSVLHQYLFRRLLRYVDVLTVHSPLNQAEAGRLFPQQCVELVLFGIPSEKTIPPVVRQTDIVKVLSVGNDVHRDWPTLVTALGNKPGIELTIVSSTAPADIGSAYDNVKVARPSTNAMLEQLFADSTITVVPLKSNLHASGITVIQEAALKGKVVIASDVGGLEAYFDHNEVLYVPEADTQTIYRAVTEMAADSGRRLNYAIAAQAKMTSESMGCAAYVRRHVDLSRRLLGK
jgi:glycosyltransferase involved in cell wall biosynthesis